MALFPERRPNRRTLFLNHRSLIGNGLGGSNIANKLLDCWVEIGLEAHIFRGGGAAGRNSREAMAATTPDGVREEKWQ